MTQQYKVGDKVKVLSSDWPTLIPVGSIAEVTRAPAYGGVDLGDPEMGDLLYFADNEVELVDDDKPEVGDTVEVTFKDGTVVTGVVKNPNVRDGYFYVGDVVYVAGWGTSTTRIITKAVKKPKVWAVGDVVECIDYTSETIPKGTLVKGSNATLVRSGDNWTDVETGVSWPSNELNALRTIVYIP